MSARLEHLNWCKERAINEFDYYIKTEGLQKAIQNGITSMMSDINKHPDTQSESLQMLCVMQLTAGMIRSRPDFVNFIHGFH